MKSPRNLADLPFASDLRSCDDELELDGDYDRVRFDGATFDDVTCRRTRWRRAG